MYIQFRWALQLAFIKGKDPWFRINQNTVFKCVNASKEKMKSFKVEINYLESQNLINKRRYLSQSKSSSVLITLISNLFSKVRVIMAKRKVLKAA